MYKIEEKTYDYRSIPWYRPVEDRMETLKRAKNLGKKTIAFLYPIFGTATFRYRGYNVTETLENSFQWTATYFDTDEMDALNEIISYVDVFVAVRCEWDFELGDLIAKAKENGSKIVYDVDDLIYHPKYMPIVIKTLRLKKGEQWDCWFGLTQRNHMIAQMCDSFITTNGYLADYLKKDYEKPVYVIKNYLNWIQEEVSKDLLEQKQTLEPEKPFIIGYFSGSPTHVEDLMVVMPEVETFLNRHEDAKLRIVGYMQLPEEYQYLVDAGRIEYVKFQTFVGLQAEQAKVDLNIVPLVNNEFSNCKSELKYFETAIVGVPTCATPTYAYKTGITHGDNGYLCEKGEWLPVFEKFYQEGVTKEYQNYICQKALEDYGSASQLKHVEEVYNSIYAGK